MLKSLARAALLVLAAAPATHAPAQTAIAPDPAPREAPGPGPAVFPAPTPCPGNAGALGTARTLALDPARLPPVGLKTYPRSLALGPREVVLTFDDGPSARTTPAVLDALARECVRATFFLIGRNAQVNPALVRREIADGHTVGHHSWSHPAMTERGLEESAARADIDHGFAADDRAAYGEAGAGPRVPFFRFPGFADTPALTAWLRGRGVAVFGADLWASDWNKQTPEAELALLMSRLDRAGGGIVLLHDIKAQTAAMLPALLAALKAGNYRVVALVPGTAPAPLRDAPPGWTSQTEEALASMRAHSPPATESAPRLAAPGPGTPPPGTGGAGTPAEPRAAGVKAGG